MRIGGLASGMDTEQMIKDLMRVQRLPMDKLTKRKQTIEWQRDAYREINTKLAKFNTNIFDTIMRSANMSAKSVTTSNSSRITATATAAAANGSFTISKVERLATAATNSSIGRLSETTVPPTVPAYRIDPTKRLEDQNFAKPIDWDKDQNFAITTYNTSGEAVRHEFEIKKTDSLNDVIKKINDSKAGVSAFYDEHADKITLMRKDTGNNNANGKEMVFEGNFLTSTLGLDADKEEGGENAELTINGLNTERRTNTFSINGVTITLKEAFTDSPVSLTVNTNTDKIFDTIKGFIDEYNELINTINGKLKEERFRDFGPLTDEQKEAMSEKDIEKWEEKAMSGMLRNDQTLSNALDRMRSAMYSPVSLSGDNPTFKQLAELGITTSRDFMERGKLEIDESKLRAAIEKDPDGVFQIFNADGATASEKGLARRMRDNLSLAMDQVAERAGGSRGKNLNHQFTLGRNITDIDRQISNFERRLKQIEDRYWKQFSAMEKAMQQANSQAETMFAQLFGGQ